MASIAKQVGCSKGTVSRALKHDTQISQELIKKIEMVSNELGYKVTIRSKASLQHNTKKSKNICLFFPYSVDDYTLTPLDTMIFNNISRWAQKEGIKIHITRLTDTGTLPEYITKEPIDGFLMKSHAKPSRKKCPLLNEVPLVQMFAFAPNLDDDVQVAVDAKRCIDIIFEQLIHIKSYRQIIMPVDDFRLNHEILLKIKYIEEACKILDLPLLRYPMDEKILTVIQNNSHSMGDTLVILLRCNDTMEQILREQLKLVVPTCEIINMVYEYNCSFDSTTHWLDMRGKDIVSLAWDNLLAIIDKGYGVGADILIRPELHLSKSTIIKEQT